MATTTPHPSDSCRRPLGGVAAAAAFALLPTWGVDAQEPTPEPEPSPVRRPVILVDPLADEVARDDGFDSYDALGWAMFVAFLVFAAWIIWWFYKKAQDAVGGGGSFNSVEEAVFEREAIRGVAVPAPDKPPAELPAPIAAAPPAPPAPSAGFPFGPPAAALPTPAGELNAGDLGRRLQALGVFDSIEGTVALPLPPDGVIWRLKRGGSALVLPRAESEATMAHFARRFDYVIVPAAGGEALVIRRLENQIREWTRG